MLEVLHLFVIVELSDCSRRVPGYFTLIVDNAPPTARYNDEVVHA